MIISTKDDRDREDWEILRYGFTPQYTGGGSPLFSGLHKQKLKLYKRVLSWFRRPSLSPVALEETLVPDYPIAAILGAELLPDDDGKSRLHGEVIDGIRREWRINMHQVEIQTRRDRSRCGAMEDIIKSGENPSYWFLSDPPATMRLWKPVRMVGWIGSTGDNAEVLE